MKTVGASLQSHLRGDVTTLATLIKITRTDLVVYGFTSHDRALTVSGVVYEPVNSFDRSEVGTTSGMNVDNMDLLALISSASLAEGELKAGLFDFANVEFFMVNWADLTQGTIKLRKGNLGEISVTDGDVWKGELRGSMQRLQQTIGRIYTLRCDADLGDARCAVALGPITQTGAVVTATSRSSFTTSGLAGADGLFNDGLLTWTSGSNNGLRMEVKRWLTAGQIDLHLPMPYNVTAADTMSVYPGCDKNLATCLAKFANVVNFRGFPKIPGRDAVTQYPDSPY